MHSSVLRSHDFDVSIDGAAKTHADVFADIAMTSRLGVVCPHPLDAFGAATLIMACVTAFYDRYRATGEEFFAYPDFFSFQLDVERPVDFGQLDLWPTHKNVAVERGGLTDAITERGVDVLVLPSTGLHATDLSPVQSASLQRTLKDAWLYAGNGACAPADTRIQVTAQPLTSWMEKISTGGIVGRATTDGDHLQQTFQRISTDDAIARL